MDRAPARREQTLPGSLRREFAQLKFRRYRAADKYRSKPRYRCTPHSWMAEFSVTAGQPAMLVSHLADSNGIADYNLRSNWRMSENPFRPCLCLRKIKRDLLKMPGTTLMEADARFTSSSARFTSSSARSSSKRNERSGIPRGQAEFFEKELVDEFSQAPNRSSAGEARYVAIAIRRLSLSLQQHDTVS